MNYIKCEFKRVFNVKVICVLLLLVSFVSFIFGRFIIKQSVPILLGVISNFNLVYLIACSSIITTEDFELGTYKNIFTGRYSFIQIIILKLIVYLLISLFLSFVVGAVCIANMLVLGKNYDFILYSKIIMKSIVVYLSCSVFMFSFSQLLALTFKNFSVNLIIMFSLCYGIFSELINLFSGITQGFLSKMISVLPFSNIPKMMINREFSWVNIGVLIISALLVLLFIELCKKLWFK